MISRYSALTMFILALLLAAGVKPAGAAAPTAESAGFTTVTTHIEADPWRIFKIERPEPLIPRNAAPPAGGNTPSSYYINWLGLISLNKYGDQNGQARSLSLSLAKVPFFTSLIVNKEGDFINQGGMKAIDWYWFALLDGTTAQDLGKKNAMGSNITYARVAILDAPLAFTGFKLAFDASQGVYWEALDVPLATTLSHRAGKDRNQWRFLNIPFFWVWRYDRDGSATTTNLLSSLASVYSREQYGRAQDRWDFLSIPFVSVATGRKNQTSTPTLDSVTILEGATVYDNSLFFLWRRQVDGNKVASTQVLKLPFLGPVAATWSDSVGGGSGVFPKLFSHKHIPDSLKTVF